jgi:hypothetical protein
MWQVACSLPHIALAHQHVASCLPGSLPSLLPGSLPSLLPGSLPSLLPRPPQASLLANTVMGQDYRQRSRLLRTTSTLERLSSLKAALQGITGPQTCRVM